MEKQVSSSSSDLLMRESLLDQSKQAPTQPGVYLMRDKDRVVIYVGKAKSLKSRLQSYFQPETHPVPRTQLLVSRVFCFDIILTETEAEALILENQLIKKHRPKFNVRLKDDKTYPYLRISLEEPFPRIQWTRKVKKDVARYYGPFTSALAAREVMGLLNETFKLRDCSDNTFRHRSRPCILYQMKKCTAPCVGLISQQDYQDSMGQVMQILEGKTDRLMKELRRGMEEASKNQEFELAAQFRDQLQNLELVTATQVVQEAGSNRDRDVLGLARKDSIAHGVVLLIRQGLLLAVKHYDLQNSDASLSNQEILTYFLTQYIFEQTRIEEKLTLSRATEFLLPEAPNEPDLLEKAWSIHVRVPESENDHQLIQIALNNAQHALEQAAKKAKGHGGVALEELQKKLHLEKLPTRIECYDISNIQGQEAVASRVVFEDGAPAKNFYRKYKIQTVDQANDFAMMREVLYRRFSNPEEVLPDLVVVDGGKGQLSQAVAILEELQIQGVALVGLAKARTERDFRSKEVQSSFERVFIPGRKNPIPLYPTTAAYKLLTHIRDEAHRFAITYHRQLRDRIDST